MVKNKKNIYGYVLSFLIGLFIATSLAIVILSFFLFLLKLFFQLDKQELTIYLVVYFSLLIVSAIIGGIYGLKSYKQRNVYWTIWRLTKQTLVTTVIITAVIFLLIFIFAGYDSKLLIFTFVPIFIFSYPFSALLYFLITHYKDTRKYWVLIILLVLINPVFITLSRANITYTINTAKAPRPCGFMIVNVESFSPFNGTDVLNKSIQKIGAIDIVSQQDAILAIQSINSTNPITVQIDNKSFVVRPIYLNETNRYSLGLLAKEIKCSNS